MPTTRRSAFPTSHPATCRQCRVEFLSTAERPDHDHGDQGRRPDGADRVTAR